MADESDNTVRSQSMFILVFLTVTLVWGIALALVGTKMLWAVLANNLGLSIEVPIAPFIKSLGASALVILASALAIREVVFGAYLLELLGLWLMVSTILRAVAILYRAPEFITLISVLPSVTIFAGIGFAVVKVGRVEVRRLRGRVT